MLAYPKKLTFFNYHTIIFFFFWLKNLSKAMSDDNYFAWKQRYRHDAWVVGRFLY